MDFNENFHQTSKILTNSETQGAEISNVTVFSTPRPRATSTVERRTLGSRYAGIDFPGERYLQCTSTPFDDNSVKSSVSSLGILENLSSFLSDDNEPADKQKPNCNNLVDEREMARKLLQRCSEIHLSNSASDTNKENNANSSNISEERTPSTLLDPNQSFGLTPVPTKVQNISIISTAKASTASVNFEPDEITGRSSELSKSLEMKDLQSSSQNIGNISYRSGTAELMAQFENDFQSGSQMASQFLADEISWQQNASYALPIATSGDKEHLNLSCFSGIIGDLDLTVESCAGRKVSVGEFFQRKCNNVGNLSDVGSSDGRPNFGATINSPTRNGNNVPLVDLTTETEESALDSETTKEHTLMSLSTIAQTLKDIENGTPRRLVDQLLMAKKQMKKLPDSQLENLTSDTYTLLMPSSRNSLPVCPSTIKKFDEQTMRNSKLSLDSKLISDTSTLNHQNVSRHSAEPAASQVDSSFPEILSEKLRVSNSSTVNLTGTPSQSTDNHNYSSITRTLDKPQLNAAKLENFPFQDLQNVVQSRGDSKSEIKRKEISAQRSALEATVSANKSPKSETSTNVFVGISKESQELHCCIIGVRREIDIELVNRSERWIICSLNMNQIQGDKDNIQLDVTPKMMLLPNSHKTVKVGVKVLKSSKPILAAFTADMSEMPLRMTKQEQHVMCFVPEEPNIIVTTESGNNDLDFQTTHDSSSKTLFVKLENKNNIEVSLKISLINNRHLRFQLEYHRDHPKSEGSLDKDSMCLTLNPSQQFKLIIRYNGTFENDGKVNESDNGSTKLSVRIYDENTDIPIKEIPIFCHVSVPKQTLSCPERSYDISRCGTPQNLGITCSSTSPHSSTSNKSGLSGRNSPHSSVSGVTVAGDSISIRATHAALVWNSIKVGKHDTKEFTIRNTSNNKIKLEATIVDNDNSFKFVRDRQQMQTHIILGLQRMESKTFSIVFSPNNSGAAAGRIVFKHYEPRRDNSDSQSRPSKVIFLYGYGGVGKVDITEAFKDTGGRLWLSLGSLNAGGTLDARIKLQNTGDLCSFAKVKLTPKAVYPAMVSSWHVDPTELMLGPKEVRWVTLEFRPRKEDLALLRRANVSHVGTLTITHGDEPTRLRIRRLYKKLSQIGQMSGKENEAFRNIVYPICKVFPGEIPIHNLNIIRDSVENLGDLCRGVRQHEVMLTMEVDAEESMCILHDNADESQIFYSLCSDDSNVFPATEESFMPSETLMESTMNPRIFEDDFSVNPSSITLKPPAINEATVTIMSSLSVAQPFDTVISHSEYLSVVPAEGMIPTRRGLLVRIQCKKKINHSIDAVLQVYTANERRDVQIRVVFGGNSMNVQ